MNTQKSILVLTLICVGVAVKIFAADAPTSTRYEYITLRWAGRENTHLIRPDRSVEFIGAELRRISKPNNADERSFYMNAALNSLAAQGYELTAMTPDDMILRRTR